MDRISSEKHTVKKMVELYCKLNHDSDVPCGSCHELITYAHHRLDHCRFKEMKPVCAKCKTHCYQQEMRDRIRVVMQFSGPRMLFYCPFELFLYLIRKIRYA